MLESARLDQSSLGSTSQVRFIRTHNAYHLGDNLVHLHFLRKIARQLQLSGEPIMLVHACLSQYHHELRPLVEDTPNLKLCELDTDRIYAFKNWNPSHVSLSDGEVSVNAWRGVDDIWYNHKDRADFVKFHVEHWFPYLAQELGVKNPVKSAGDMLFDYPAIRSCGEKLPTQFRNRFDLLLVNSAPGSGQFRGYDEFLLAQLAQKIADRGFRVISTAPLPPSTLKSSRKVLCTADDCLSVTDIGHLSLNCRVIAGVSTGPMWTTHNVWNSLCPDPPSRIVLLDNERVELSPNTRHVDNIADAASLMAAEGLL